ncbi:MAG: SagB/ThcOx family dehydrogenase [Saccharolobus sp.]|uniref:SagB/ThcOx family dehydrogenase n=1 Tax=Thermoprotei TaxID=183924 RepID=UPI003164088F
MSINNEGNYSYYRTVIKKAPAIRFANLDIGDKILQLRESPPLWSLYVSLINQLKCKKYPNLEDAYTIQFFNENPSDRNFTINQDNFDEEINKGGSAQSLNLLEGILLKDVLLKRRSLRKFIGKINLQQLYTILCGTFFNSHYIEFESNKKKFLRPYPSPGALYPNRIYVISLNVDNLMKGGIYYYDPNKSSLIFLGKREMNEINEAFMEPDLVSTAATIIVIVTDMSMIYAKYGELGYKLALIEAGSILQLITLLASSLNIPNLPYESFYNYSLCKIIGINCVDQFPATTILIG